MYGTFILTLGTYCRHRDEVENCKIDFADPGVSAASTVQFLFRSCFTAGGNLQKQPLCPEVGFLNQDQLENNSRFLSSRLVQDYIVNGFFKHPKLENKQYITFLKSPRYERVTPICPKYIEAPKNSDKLLAKLLKFDSQKRTTLLYIKSSQTAVKCKSNMRGKHMYIYMKQKTGYNINMYMYHYSQ